MACVLPRVYYVQVYSRPYKIITDFATVNNDRREFLSQTLTLSVEAAGRLSIDLFVSLGLSEADAAATVWPLVDAESMGIATHGLN
ncbi:MAG: hypothetical protein ACTSQ7_12370, partial [Alphaproteobacteria bacterium]